ncbi:pseudouridine synthase [Sphingomonas koreensis]|nr:pseudouridine synthase [Sphingomonas koreensis]
MSATVPPSKPKDAAQSGHRIAKLLARAGVASRREIERMITDGRVALNGKVLDTPATILASLHGVTVDGNPVEEARPAQLFLFHKPSGVLTAERDFTGRPTIYDRLPKDLPRLVPVGRLDLNTEGLLLLTTDGAFKRQLELPATGVERAYRARAYGDVTQAQLEELIEGVEIEGMRYGPIDANLERRTGANVWIELILTEGKNREVRRVLEYLGLQVSRLIRTRYGPFVLGDLPPGGIGEVRQADLVAFRQSLAGKRRGSEEAIEVAPRAAATPAAAPARPAIDKREARPRSADGRAAAPARERRPASPTRATANANDRTPRPERARTDRATGDRTPRAAADRTDQRRTGPRAATPAPRGERSQRSSERSSPSRSDRAANFRREREDSAPARSDRSQRPDRSNAPRRAGATDDAPKPRRPKRGPGWAKAKPKPARPKPRGGPRR